MSESVFLFEPEPLDIEASRTYSFEGILPNPKDPAYIIFTSGSTGLPKGVMISHENVCNTLMHISEGFFVDSGSVILGISSFCFDLSVFDILGAVISGARLVLVQDARDVPTIRSLLQAQGITLWNSVPAIMRLVLDGCPLEWRCETMKTVFLSGDWIPISLIPDIRLHFPNAEIISLGGATEAAIWSIFYKVSHLDSDWKSIPYGYSLPNQSIYVLRPDGTPCGSNETGEIHIGGASVGLGYVSDHEKTKKAFVYHENLGRLYKTGDYGVFRPGGYVEFLGRIDAQVKVNGFRVELTEIDEQAKFCEGVRDAAAVLIERNGAKQIGLCYCADTQRTSSSTLRNHLKASLPDYMVPAVLLQLDSIILNSSHKIDRPSMAKLFSQNRELPQGEPCVSDLEKKIAAVWQEVLAVENVTRDSDFFSLGGNSLKAIQILDRMKASGISPEALSIQAFISKTTVREIAVAVQALLEDENAYEYEVGAI